MYKKYFSLNPTLVVDNVDEMIPYTCVRGCCAFCEIFDICEAIGPFNFNCPGVSKKAEYFTFIDEAIDYCQSKLGEDRKCKNESCATCETAYHIAKLIYEEKEEK